MPETWYADHVHEETSDVRRLNGTATAPTVSSKAEVASDENFLVDECDEIRFELSLPHASRCAKPSRSLQSRSLQSELGKCRLPRFGS